MMSTIESISDWLDQFSLWLAMLAIFVILIISIYGAFFRYVMNDPLPWPLPVERLLMVWAALLGIPAALKRGQHMGVEGLIQLLPRKVELAVRYFNHAAIALFVLCLLWYGWLEVSASNDLYMISADARISSKWIQAAIPVSAVVHLIHLFTTPQMVRRQMSSSTAPGDS